MSGSQIDGEKEPSLGSSRAKFYVFEKGHWQDKGTGNVECFVPEFGTPTIVLFAEMSEISSDDHASTSRKVLLVPKIKAEGFCGLEGNCLKTIANVVLWREVDEFTGGDKAYALSFQDCDKCWTVWKIMMSAKPGCRLRDDGKLFRTSANKKSRKITLHRAFSEQKPLIPWYSHHLTTWQSDLWECRMSDLRGDRKDDMRPPSIRPRDLIVCSNVDAAPSVLEPLFEGWFISQVLSFLDLPSIVKLDTALSCFLLRNRWLEALPMIKCPSSVDNFDLHARNSIQWLISRRVKISRLSIVPWYMYSLGGSDSLDEGDASCIFEDFNLGDSLQTLEIVTTGSIEGEDFGDWGAFHFSTLHSLSTSKALQSLTLELGGSRSRLHDDDLVPLLSELTQLKKLKLKYDDLSDDVLEALARDSHQLEDVEITMEWEKYGPGASFDAFANLVMQLPLLRRLVLHAIDSPVGGSETMLASLVQCPLLEELFLSHIYDEITDQDVRGFIERCNKLTKLGFYSYAFKESHFAIIGSSTSITSLTFKECDGCTDNALAALARDGRLQLKEIVIGFEDDSELMENITDVGVMSLAMNFAVCLESVSLTNCDNVTDDGLAAFAICPHLRSITVDCGEQITGTFLDPLTDSCRGLEKISFDGSSDDVNIQAIADRCPLLRDITLRRLSVYDEEIVSLVRGCPLLTHVRLFRDYFSDITLAAIGTGLPHLEVLSLHSNSRYETTQSGMRFLLENCPRITFLNVGVSEITDRRLLKPWQRITSYHHRVSVISPALLRMIVQRRVLVAGLFNNERLRW